MYRVDPSGRVDQVVGEDQVPDPNGLAFSPDYKRLYVISTGRGPDDTGPGGNRDMHVFDVGSDNKPSNRQVFTDFMVDGRSAVPTACAAMWMATCGARATPAAPWATAA